MLPPGPEFTITYPPWEFNEKMLKKLKLSIDKGGENAYNIPCSRGLRLTEIEAWLSLVERCVRDAEAAGSNPVASTSERNIGSCLMFLFYSPMFVKKTESR